MDVKKFSGVYPAVITPFDAEGEVDVAKLENYINYLCDKVDGLFVGGSYGSGPIMTVAQRKTLAEVTIKTCAGRVPVIMHIGTTNLADTIELAQHAEKAGADALAAVTPFYYRHTPNVIKQYYADLINSVDLPVIAYNNPKYSNFCISGDFLAELADIGLQGIKDSSADISLFYDFMAKVDKEGFLFLIGSQTHLLPAVVGGAHGCVSGLSNAFPEFIKEIYTKCKEGKFAEARDIGLPRRPFLPLPEQEVERIRKVLTETQMIIG